MELATIVGFGKRTPAKYKKAQPWCLGKDYTVC